MHHIYPKIRKSCNENLLLGDFPALKCVALPWLNRRFSDSFFALKSEALNQRKMTDEFCSSGSGEFNDNIENFTNGQDNILRMFKGIAVRAAREAGRIHLKYFKHGIGYTTKSTHYDRVTIADTEAEATVVSIIRQKSPEHNIIAEEGKYRKTASEYTWIIDPLDGTNNFSQGLPIFCVSIGLAKNGKLLLGCIYDATRKELFYAERGKGAFLNSKRIAVSDRSALRDCMFVTGFYYDRREPMRETLRQMESFLTKGIIGMRRLGSAALDLCNVAAGRVDGYWEFMLNPWDFAAGKVIVEEAGGRVTDRFGKEIGIQPSYVVASNGRIHRKMISLLNLPHRSKK